MVSRKDLTAIKKTYATDNAFRIAADLKKALGGTEKHKRTGVARKMADILKKSGLAEVTVTGKTPVVSALLPGTTKYDIRLAAEHTMVRPLMQAPVPGRLPDVIALEKPQELVITATLDLKSTDADITAVARAITLMHALKKGIGKNRTRLKRGIRLYIETGAHGLQEYLNDHYPMAEGARSSVVSGVSLVGSKGGVTIPAFRTPTYQQMVLEDLLKNEKIGTDLRSGQAGHGTLFALAPFAVPVFTLHNDLAEADMITLAVSYLLTCAGLDEKQGKDLAARIYRSALRQLGTKGADKTAVIADAQDRWTNLPRLFHSGPWLFNKDHCKEYRRKKMLVKGYLFTRTAFELDLADWYKKLVKKAGPLPKKKAALPGPAVLRAKADKLVPIGTLAGPVRLDKLSVDARKQLDRITGAKSGKTPDWLLMAGEVAQGKKPVTALYSMLKSAGYAVSLDKLVKTYRFLEKHKLVRFRAVICKTQIKKALRKVGVKKGDIMIAHCGLMSYGYIPGGPKEVIGCLLEAVGKTGTLFMVGHSLSWVGQMPFDHQRSNGIGGVVTNIYRKYPGIVRSRHPTHSVCGIGPMAGTLTEGHDHTVSPMDRNSFWGKFHDNDGRILIFCNDFNANTFLHCVDVWNGVPFLSVTGHFLKNGKRIEAEIPGEPFHGDGFPYIYEAMFKKKQITSYKLGEDTVYSMKARDALASGAPVLKRKPQLATGHNCECGYCKNIRKIIARRKKRK